MRIRNWKQFQHYKNRRPPWIKLHREILDDPDWHSLSGDSAKVLISLWLIASDDNDKDGKLPPLRKLAFRLRMSEKVVAQHLEKLSQWLVQDASNALADCEQLAVPETEESRDRDRVFSQNAPLASNRFQKPTLEELTAYVKEAGLAKVNPDRFMDHYETNGWKVGKNPMKDWKAAARNWNRNDFGGGGNRQSPPPQSGLEDWTRKDGDT